MITAERLREILDYDLETGVFTWKKKTCRKVVVGSVAGCQTKEGYITIRVDGYLMTGHRLAWLYVNGTLPSQGIDHKNRDKADNRICNLRLCTPAENGQNAKLSRANKSGVSGVFFNSKKGKWTAQITVNRKNIVLGAYDSIDEAAASRRAAEVKYHTFRHTEA